MVPSIWTRVDEQDGPSKVLVWFTKRAHQIEGGDGLHHLFSNLLHISSVGVVSRPSIV
ncbi:hypothetical protein HPP92_004632 [Vanilla planifolia]|uniref:Uncharacterized protein n=1 Tax=Vanilla planifolia TaxID=51239 RepID=A0A835RLF4_VANPL|nr:hypothetical protein HPP92_004632 [Vanilla planifolia]